MKITIVAFEGCMTSAVYGQSDAFAIAAYIAARRHDASWSDHDVRIAMPSGAPVPGYGGHPIKPDCALADAQDSDVVLVPPIFNDIEQPSRWKRRWFPGSDPFRKHPPCWHRPAPALSCWRRPVC